MDKLKYTVNTNNKKRVRKENGMLKAVCKETPKQARQKGIDGKCNREGKSGIKA